MNARWVLTLATSVTLGLVGRIEIVGVAPDLYLVFLNRVGFYPYWVSVRVVKLARHAGLRGQWGKPHEGSTPSPDTMYFVGA